MIINQWKKTLFEKFSKKIAEEYQQLNLWYFVSFIIGIIIFFNNQLVIATELKYFFSILTLVILLLLANYLLNRAASNLFLRFLLFCSIFCLFGFAVAMLRERLATKTSLEKITDAQIIGKITSIKPTLRGRQLILTLIKNNPARENIVKDNAQNLSKIRLNLARKFTADLAIGDIISLKTKLFPLPKPVLPGTYDFGFFLRLASIEATGYALTAPKIINAARNDILTYLKSLRQKIYTRLIDILGTEKGNFAAAILIGQTKAIPEDLARNLRDTGVAHILSVSGLHLSLVAMIFFLTSRFILNISNFFAYHTNVKTIAAIISLFGSFSYLQLSGNNIAAIRAFIMTSIFIIALILGREPYPIRSVLLAGFFIICFSPEYIFHPAFQLSFIAVLCLISGYELYSNLAGSVKITGILRASWLYLFSNIYTSFIASIATAPILIYHFYKFPNYSIIMNLAAVPLMSFCLMPLALLALLLMPFGIDQYCLELLGYFIDLINQLAAYLVKQPYAITYFGQISSLSLLIFVSGFFWLCFWQKKWRIYGLCLIILGIIMIYREEKPVFSYSHRYKSITVKNSSSDRIIIYSKNSLNHFITDYWQNWFGVANTQLEIKNILPVDYIFKLDHNLTLSLNYDHCQKANIMVVLSEYLHCPNTNFAPLLLVRARFNDNLLIFCSSADKCRIKLY